VTELSEPSPPAQTIFEQIQGTIARLSTWVGEEEPLDVFDHKSSTSISFEPLAAPWARNALRSLEKSLDNYVASLSEWVRSQRRQPGASNSSSWLLRWAWQRSLAVDDPRSKEILRNVVDGPDELFVVEEYLKAYDEERFLRWTPLSEVVSRWRTLFGSGWFFEWPRGRNPLNSTWPWTDVRPALCVLWGVCWMFYNNRECQHRYGVVWPGQQGLEAGMWMPPFHFHQRHRRTPVAKVRVLPHSSSAKAICCALGFKLVLSLSNAAK
jgi:hypothetical protein